MTFIEVLAAIVVALWVHQVGDNLIDKYIGRK